MGQPKLLLPLGERTVISRVLEVLRPPGIARTYVVVRSDDLALQAEVVRAGAVPVVPEQPPSEMRQSVEIALRQWVADFQPEGNDAWLLMPADHPLLDSSVLAALLDRWREGGTRILIPVCEGRRGHPVIFHWSLVPHVFALPPDVGLNQLVRQHADEVTELEVANPAILTDLDTPEDYARLRAQFREATETLRSPEGHPP